MKFEALVKTVVIIQESKLSEIEDRLGKDIVCEKCSEECTFYKCRDKKVTMHDNRLANIGYELFIFLSKAHLIFGEVVRPWIDDLNSGKEMDFRSHWSRIDKVMGKKIGKLEIVREKFQKKMEQKYRGTKKKVPVKNSKSESGGAGNAKDGKSKDNSKKEAELNSKGLELSNFKEGEISEDGENLPFDNKNKLNNKSLEIGSKLLTNRKESFDDNKEEKKERKIEKVNEDTDSEKEEGSPGKDSNKSVDSMKIELSLENETAREIHRESLYKSKRQIDIFLVTEICDKFSTAINAGSKSKAAIEEIDSSENPYSSPSKGEKESGDQKDRTQQGYKLFHSSAKLKLLFNKSELDQLEEEYEAYQNKLVSHKVNSALGFYQDNIRKIRLSYSNVLLKDEKFQVIQNTIFYVSPNIFNYRSMREEQTIIKKLLIFPPRTRKKVLLKELHLYIGNLVEYQKLYAFKELVWIVRIADIIKLVNIAFIIFINLFLLFSVDLQSKDTAGEKPFLYSILVISCVVSGVCSIFTPIEKLFLAKTYVSSFNSFKSRMEADYKEMSLLNEIVEYRQTSIYFYGKLISFMQALHTLISVPCSKYLIALTHYDNLFQFIIFYLSVISVLSKSVKSYYASIFLILVKTSTLFKLYAHLNVKLFSIFLYLVATSIVVYVFGLVYFIFFSDTFSHDSGLDCANLTHCIAFAISFGLLGTHGYTEGVASVGKDLSEYYYREVVDTGIQLIIPFFFVVMFMSRLL